MELIGTMFEFTVSIMQLPINIFGFEFSFWQVFLFSIVTSIIGWFLGEVFLGD